VAKYEKIDLRSIIGLNSEPQIAAQVKTAKEIPATPSPLQRPHSDPYASKAKTAVTISTDYGVNLFFLNQKHIQKIRTAGKVFC